MVSGLIYLTHILASVNSEETVIAISGNDVQVSDFEFRVIKTI